MPPRGLTSGPSCRLAEIDAGDPAALIYSPHPRGECEITLCFAGEQDAGWTGGKNGDRDEEGRGRKKKIQKRRHVAAALLAPCPFVPGHAPYS